MAATVYDEPGRIRRSSDAGERLRVEKLGTSKGIGVMTAMIIGFFLTIATAFALAYGVGPEIEENRGLVHEELDQPLDAIDDPRTIGDRAE